jgi:hypothetical protein
MELPDLVIIYRTYHMISEYQNQFPALTWTYENVLAPSESSLNPPIIYPYTVYHASIKPPTSYHLKRESPGTSGGTACRKERERADVRM